MKLGQSFLHLKQIRVCAGVDEYKNKFFVVLLPYQQPVGLQMTLHASLITAMQRMWLILWRKCSCLCEYGYGLDENIFIKSTFNTPLERTSERAFRLNLIFHL